MLGAIIGDIVGSIYDFNPIKTKVFEFFTPHCFFTDDTVCTAAVANILLHDLPPVVTMQIWCRRYPDKNYSLIFNRWIDKKNPNPYYSFGNGAAMRVSPAAFLHKDSLIDALAAADMVTTITHNHPEGMKGAQATTHAIWLALQGETPANIRHIITNEYKYNLTKTVDQIRPSYSDNDTCQDTVPQAITCALESVSFEDAVRNAISLGGDAGSLGAITGPIAEALHGIPDEFIFRVMDDYLYDAPDIRGLLRKMYYGV